MCAFLDPGKAWEGEKRYGEARSDNGGNNARMVKLDLGNK